MPPPLPHPFLVSLVVIDKRNKDSTQWIHFVFSFFFFVEDFYYISLTSVFLYRVKKWLVKSVESFVQTNPMRPYLISCRVCITLWCLPGGPLSLLLQKPVYEKKALKNCSILKANMTTLMTRKIRGMRVFFVSIDHVWFISFDYCFLPSDITVATQLFFTFCLCN